MKEKFSAIQNIIFDLGEVIVDLDIEATVKAFEKLLVNPQQTIYSYVDQTPIFNQIEVGAITPEQFASTIQELCHPNTTQQQIFTAWNAMLIYLPPRKIEFVQKLRKNYQTFVLSNTNEIHINYLNQNLLNELNAKSLHPFFDYVYYSHEIKQRKPDLAAFKYILDKHQINPTNTLFIDDKLENIISPQDLNIQTWHLTNREDLYELETILS